MVHLITGYAGYEHIQSEDDGSFNAAFFGSGQYVLESGNQFSASIIDNNTIRILDGDGLMYGRHFRVKPNTYEDITIQTGTAGVDRIDLICAVYRKNQENGTETVAFEVVKGTAASSPKVPNYTNGNILNGAILNYMPLYKVTINGVVLTKIEKMFTIIPTYKKLAEQSANQFQAKVDEYSSTVAGKMDATNGTAIGAVLQWTGADGSTIKFEQMGTASEGLTYGFYVESADGGEKNFYPLIRTTKTDGHTVEFAKAEQGVKADNAMPKVDGTAENPTLKWALSDGGTVELKRTGTQSAYYLNLMHTDKNGNKTYNNIISSTKDGYNIEFATRQQGERADNAMPISGGALKGWLHYSSYNDLSNTDASVIRQTYVQNSNGTNVSTFQIKMVRK